MDPALEQHFTDELRADPVVKEYYDKSDYKSVPDVLKGFAHAQKRLGSVVPLPNGEAKPEDIENWRKENLPKLINAKLIDAPRQAPEKYEIKRPDGLPEGSWNEPLEAKVHGWAKKHGLSQDALSEAMGLYYESFGGAAEAFQVNRQEQAAKVKEWADKEGISIEQLDAALDRFNKDPRGWDPETAEAISKSGWADNPLVVKAIYKLMMDSGTFDTRNDQESTTETMSADEAEIIELMKVLNDPKHQDYSKLNTSANQAKIDAYWKKKAGDAQYVIS